MKPLFKIPAYISFLLRPSSNLGLTSCKKPTIGLYFNIYILTLKRTKIEGNSPKFKSLNCNRVKK